MRFRSTVVDLISLKGTVVDLKKRKKKRAETAHGRPTSNTISVVSMASPMDFQNHARF
jgi:hypothetical protein